jgi:predicted amidohydrolase YtcJ
VRFIAAAAVLLLVPFPASADVLIDNVIGVSFDEEGKLEDFNGLLIGHDGRIEQVLTRRDKRPANVDYKLDGKGRVLVPGLIDSHVELLELGFALLAAETGAQATEKHKPRPEDRDLAFGRAQAFLLEQGFTTVADIGTTIEDWQTYRRAGDLGELQIRIVAYADGVDNMSLIGGPGPSPWLYDDRLRLSGVSLRLDGSLGSREAWLRTPYTDEPASKGKPAMDDTQLRNLMSRAAIDNFQVSVKATGDAAVGAVLDAIIELSETYQGDRRWRIEHARLVDPARLAEFSQHGVVASMQPEEVKDWTASDTRLGPDRIAGTDAWRSLSTAGAALAFGSGAPAHTANPFAAMASALLRQDENGQPFAGWQPLEKLNRETAFAAFTTGGAHALFAEGRLGRIALGRRADFLLVDRDPFLSTPDQLAAIRVLQTWVGGKLVHDAEDGSHDERRTFEGH